MKAPFLASRHEKWGVLFFRPNVYFVATDAAARIDYDGIKAASAVCASSPFSPRRNVVGDANAADYFGGVMGRSNSLTAMFLRGCPVPAFPGIRYNDASRGQLPDAWD